MAQHSSCRVPGVLRKPVFHGDYSFNTGTIRQFSIADNIVFSGVLLVSAGIGLYHAWAGRKKVGIEEFLLASRSMSAFPVGLSLLASFESAISLLGIPAEIYNHTTMLFWSGISYFFVAVAAAHIYFPVFYRLGVTSAYQYLEMRFSKNLRRSTSCIFVFSMVPYISMVLYTPSLALNAVTGFTLWGALIPVGIIATVYTTLGGIRAVLWTDSFQILMMISGLVAILARAALTVGSWDAVWEANVRTHRILFDDVRLHPSVRHTVWSVMIGAFFTHASIYCVNQAQVQRALTCHTLQEGKIALWMSFPGLCILLYLSCFIGLYMSAFYENCDPLEAKLVADSNQILPLFVMDILGDIKGLPGLFVATLFSGALSSVSTGINSVATAILEDLLLSFSWLDSCEISFRRITQYLSLFIGFLCLGLTYVVSQQESILEAAWSIHGMVSAPLLGVFSLGMFFPWANARGAACGLFITLISMLVIAIGHVFTDSTKSKDALTCVSNCNATIFNYFTTREEITEPVKALFTLSYTWYGPMSFLMVIFIGLAVSFITGPCDPKLVDPDLIVPLSDVLFPFYFLPESIRKPLRFGVRHKQLVSHESSMRKLSPGMVDSRPPILPSNLNQKNSVPSNEETKETEI